MTLDEEIARQEVVVERECAVLQGLLIQRDMRDQQDHLTALKQLARLERLANLDEPPGVDARFVP